MNDARSGQPAVQYREGIAAHLPQMADIDRATDGQAIQNGIEVARLPAFQVFDSQALRQPGPADYLLKGAQRLSCPAGLHNALPIQVKHVSEWREGQRGLDDPLGFAQRLMLL